MTSSSYTKGADVTVFTYYRFPAKQPFNWELHIWRAAAIVWFLVGIKDGAIHFVR